jgi:hypothetical protein
LKRRGAGAELRQRHGCRIGPAQDRRQQFDQAILAFEAGREISEVEFRDGGDGRVGSLQDSFYRFATFRLNRQIGGDEVDVAGHQAGFGKVMGDQRLHQLIGTGAHQNHTAAEKIGVRNGVENLPQPSVGAA